MTVIETHSLKKWDNFSGESPLIPFFESLGKVSDEIKSIINYESFVLSYSKKKHIVSPLYLNKYFYLITKGAVHGYHKFNGKNITNWIAIENELIGTIQNLWDLTPSDEYVEAIENVEVIAIPQKTILYLFENYPITNLIGRKLAEYHYQSASERSFIARIPTALGRYERLVQSYPLLIERIPLKYLASFTAMRLETYSRLRSKKLALNPELITAKM